VDNNKSTHIKLHSLSRSRGINKASLSRIVVPVNQKFFCYTLGMNAPKPPDHEPACIACTFFQIRMGTAYPYQCQIWDLACLVGHYPSRLVYTSTGAHCPYFRKRAGKAEQKPEPPAPRSQSDSEIDIKI